MQIGKLSLHSIKAAQNAVEKNNAQVNRLSTNPFGVSFKGNVIQADVFESAKKQSATNSIAERSKLFASAVVSGINNFNEAFNSRINSIVSFGKKVTKNALDALERFGNTEINFDAIERLGNTEINFDMTGIKNRLFPDRQYSVKNLTNRSVDELKSMWTELTPQEA